MLSRDIKSVTVGQVGDCSELRKYYHAQLAVRRRPPDLVEETVNNFEVQRSVLDPGLSFWFRIIVFWVWSPLFIMKVSRSTRKLAKSKFTSRVRSKRRAAPIFNARVIAQPPIPSYIKRSIRRFTKRAFRRTAPSYGGGGTFSSQVRLPLLALPSPATVTVPSVALPSGSIRSQLASRGQIGSGGQSFSTSSVGYAGQQPGFWSGLWDRLTGTPTLAQYGDPDKRVDTRRRRFR